MTATPESARSFDMSAEDFDNLIKKIELDSMSAMFSLMQGGLKRRPDEKDTEMVKRITKTMLLFTFDKHAVRRIEEGLD